MSHPTIEALFYFLSLTVFCWRHGSCPGQHYGNVVCDTSCVTVRFLLFFFGGGWSHQADLTWLKILLIPFFLSLIFSFFFCCLHLTWLRGKLQTDEISVGHPFFLLIFFLCFWPKSLVLMPQLPSWAWQWHKNSRVKWLSYDHVCEPMIHNSVVPWVFSCLIF